MINYLQVENLTKSYGDLVLFDNISFTIGEGQRIALIGRNGSGKTTLLNILAGKDTADSGTITPRRDLRIAYLEQNPEYAADLTVLEACFRSDNPALRAIAAYEQAVADPAQDGLQEAMSRMDALAAWDYEQRAKEILSRLKINDFDKKIGQLSGGQLKRVALAAVLISEADLLILDEPTNHLDTDMTEWLEEYLTRNKAALLMVTHDRYFLDRVCSDILEVDQRSVCLYKGNYAYYVEKKQERAEAAEARERPESLPPRAGVDAPPAPGAGDQSPSPHRLLSRTGRQAEKHPHAGVAEARRSGYAHRYQDIRSQRALQAFRGSGDPRPFQLQLRPV